MASARAADQSDPRDPPACLTPLPRPPQSYDAAEFATLVDKYEKLNWRIISKPGGATVKPDEFYALYGSV